MESEKQSFLAVARDVVELEINALRRFSECLDEAFFHAVSDLLKILNDNRKIILVGIGKSGNIAHKIAATLTSTGSPAVVLHSQNALHGDLGLLSEGDAVIALSYSGETSELLSLLPFLKRRAGTLIAFTGEANSSLAQHADHVIDTSVEREACPLQLAPTSSSTTMLVAGDALAMVLMKARGFTAEDFALYHPGGALGDSLLTTVAEVMRKDSQLALVTPQASVLDTLNAMTQAKAGAAIVTHPDGTLAGIFTHGDFARSYPKLNCDLSQEPIGSLMTPQPVTISSDALAAEAVKIISERNIDDLIVLSSDNQQVVGLVDSQDLASRKLT